MPIEERSELITISVEGDQAHKALERLVRALEGIEAASTRMGAAMDTGVQSVTNALSSLQQTLTAVNETMSSMGTAAQAGTAQAAGAIRGLVVDAQTLNEVLSRLQPSAQTGKWIAPAGTRMYDPASGQMVGVGRRALTARQFQDIIAQQGLPKEFEDIAGMTALVAKQSQQASTNLQQLAAAIVELSTASQATGRTQALRLPATGAGAEPWVVGWRQKIEPMLQTAAPGVLRDWIKDVVPGFKLPADMAGRYTLSTRSIEFGLGMERDPWGEFAMAHEAGHALEHLGLLGTQIGDQVRVAMQSLFSALPTEAFGAYRQAKYAPGEIPSEVFADAWARYRQGLAAGMEYPAGQAFTTPIPIGERTVEITIPPQAIEAFKTIDMLLQSPQKDIGQALGIPMAPAPALRMGVSGTEAPELVPEMGKTTVSERELAKASKEATDAFLRQVGTTKVKEARLRELNRELEKIKGAEGGTAEATKKSADATRRSSREVSVADKALRGLGNRMWWVIRTMIVMTAVRGVQQLARTWVQAHQEMDRAMLQFTLRMGATEEELANYRTQISQVSREAIGQPAQVAEALSVAGVIAPGYEEMLTSRAAVLSRMTGGELSPLQALRFLSRQMKTFDVTAEDSTRILDAWIGGFEKSGLTMQEWTAVTQNASSLASSLNTSLEETYGLLGGISAVTGSTASETEMLVRKMRTLYTHPAMGQELGLGPIVTRGAGGEEVYRPMADILREIRRNYVAAGAEGEAYLQRVANQLGITTRQQRNMFIESIQGWDQIETAISGATDAQSEFNRAVGEAANLFETHTANMSRAWKEFLSSLGDLGPAKYAVDYIASRLELATVSLSALFGQTTLAEARAQQTQISMRQQLSALEAGVPWAGVPSLGVEPISEEARRLYEQGVRWSTYPEYARTGRLPSGAAPQAVVGAIPGAGAGVTPPTTTQQPAGPQALEARTFISLPEGVTFEEFLEAYRPAEQAVLAPKIDLKTGELWQATDEWKRSQTQQVVFIDENTKQMRTMNVLMPALARATKDLQETMENVNLQRVQQISPETWDVMVPERQAYWEQQLQQVEGFNEETELFQFFVGQGDHYRKVETTQTAMQYILQDILDVEKQQLEGMWNIPSGVTMQVPLQSLDLMRWMQEGRPAPTGEGAYPVARAPLAGTRGLAPPMTSAVEAFNAAFEQQFGHPLSITSGFRTHEEQAALYAQYGPSRAARPGTSLHEQGLAVDLAAQSARERAWQLANAPRFGLEAPLSHEPWHFQLMQQGQQQMRTPPAGAPVPVRVVNPSPSQAMGAEMMPQLQAAINLQNNITLNGVPVARQLNRILATMMTTAARAYGLRGGVR
ncbi:MAG: phage tail tape measure protein [Methanophagales archaeon]|nr:phage tail tape measure protein [Methanophagales archaeon]